MGDVEKMMCISVRNVLYVSIQEYLTVPRVQWVR